MQKKYIYYRFYLKILVRGKWKDFGKTVKIEAGPDSEKQGIKAIKEYALTKENWNDWRFEGVAVVGHSKNNQPDW